MFYKIKHEIDIAEKFKGENNISNIEEVFKNTVGKRKPLFNTLKSELDDIYNWYMNIYTKQLRVGKEPRYETRHKGSQHLSSISLYIVGWISKRRIII